MIVKLTSTTNWSHIEFNVKSIQPWAMTDHEFNRLVPAGDAINIGRRHICSLISFSISICISCIEHRTQPNVPK